LRYSNRSPVIWVTPLRRFGYTGWFLR
jgi:hypothetical protein